jgi:hypothetical protein
MWLALLPESLQPIHERQTAYPCKTLPHRLEKTWGTLTW